MFLYEITNRIILLNKYCEFLVSCSDKERNHIQATTANLSSSLQCYITPLKKPLGF